MSEKFKKGQLVACRDLVCAEWILGIFDGERDDGLYVRLPLSLTCSSKRPERFLQVKPAEEVWPDIFLGRERRTGEQAADAVAMESALVQRLRRQIEWLCQELAHADMCPSVSAIASCDKDCAECWRRAGRQAVKEDDADAFNEESPALGRCPAERHPRVLHSLARRT